MRIFKNGPTCVHHLAFHSYSSGTYCSGQGRPIPLAAALYDRECLCTRLGLALHAAHHDWGANLCLLACALAAVVQLWLRAGASSFTQDRRWGYNSLMLILDELGVRKIVRLSRWTQQANFDPLTR